MTGVIKNTNKNEYVPMKKKEKKKKKKKKKKCNGIFFSSI